MFLNYFDIIITTINFFWLVSLSLNLSLSGGRWQEREGVGEWGFQKVKVGARNLRNGPRL